MHAKLPRLQAHQSLADAVHDLLQDAITYGALQPGTRLREVELGRRLGVSPTPVREAFRRLEYEGLVVASPYRGISVVTLTAAEMADLYEIHELLEGHAVRRAAESECRDTSALEEILTDEEATLEAPDQQAFNRLDLRFHRALNELGGNGALAELIEGIHRRIQSARTCLEVHLPGRPQHSHQQHQDILNAVRCGSADRAAELARAHIRTTRDAVLRALAGPHARSQRR